MVVRHNYRINEMIHMKLTKPMISLTILSMTATVSTRLAYNCVYKRAQYNYIINTQFNYIANYISYKIVSPIIESSL